MILRIKDDFNINGIITISNVTAFYVDDTAIKVYTDANGKKDFTSFKFYSIISAEV